MTNNVGLIFSVGDTRPQFTISIEQDKLVPLNFMFSVDTKQNTFTFMQHLWRDIWGQGTQFFLLGKSVSFDWLTLQHSSRSAADQSSEIVKYSFQVSLLQDLFSKAHIHSPLKDSRAQHWFQVSCILLIEFGIRAASRYGWRLRGRRFPPIALQESNNLASRSFILEAKVQGSSFFKMLTWQYFLTKAKDNTFWECNPREPRVFLSIGPPSWH
jgi:hypothetical protein